MCEACNNRRIIAASVSSKTGFDCAPDLNVFYRWVYIALAAVPTGFLLIPDALANGWSSVGLLGLHGIALASGAFASKRLDFAGHWATVLLLSALLFWLLPHSWITNLLLMALMAWMWRRRWPQVA